MTTMIDTAPAERVPLYDPQQVVPIVERFYSVQGEGANVGRAALFIRLAGCNLSCVFSEGAVCDTPWGHANYKPTVAQLLEWVQRTTADVCGTDWQAPGFPWAPAADSDLLEIQPLPIVIITGGEPTAAPAFDALVYALKRNKLYVAVESNGTRWRDSLPLVDWLVVSPKTSIGQARPVNAAVDDRVLQHAKEVRTVITGPDSPVPPFYRKKMNFVSPALLADGSGLEHLCDGVPGFVPGALTRCMEIVQMDPRFRLSVQVHKWLKLR